MNIGSPVALTGQNLPSVIVTPTSGADILLNPATIFMVEDKTTFRRIHYGPDNYSYGYKDVATTIDVLSQSLPLVPLVLVNPAITVYTPAWNILSYYENTRNNAQTIVQLGIFGPPAINAIKCPPTALVLDYDVDTLVTYINTATARAGNPQLQIATAGSDQSDATSSPDYMRSGTIVELIGAGDLEGYELPQATPGMVVVVVNNTGQGKYVYAKTGGDLIRGLDPAAGQLIPPYMGLAFYCSSTGVWGVIGRPNFAGELTASSGPLEPLVQATATAIACANPSDGFILVPTVPQVSLTVPAGLAERPVVKAPAGEDLEGVTDGEYTCDLGGVYSFVRSANGQWVVSTSPRNLSVQYTTASLVAAVRTNNESVIIGTANAGPNDNVFLGNDGAGSVNTYISGMVMNPQASAVTLNSVFGVGKGFIDVSVGAPSASTIPLPANSTAILRREGGTADGDLYVTII